jgi:hypothetical protein
MSDFARSNKVTMCRNFFASSSISAGPIGTASAFSARATEIFRVSSMATFQRVESAA